MKVKKVQQTIKPKGVKLKSQAAKKSETYSLLQLKRKVRDSKTPESETRSQLKLTQKIKTHKTPESKQPVKIKNMERRNCKPSRFSQNIFLSFFLFLSLYLLFFIFDRQT